MLYLSIESKPTEVHLLWHASLFKQQQQNNNTSSEQFANTLTSARPS